MQRINDPRSWTRLREGEAISFPAKTRRVVRLDVNAPVKSSLFFVAEGDEAGHFLALVEGRDAVEFLTEGAFRIVCERGDVAVQTVDGDRASVELPDAISFVKLIEPRRRDIASEMMMYQARQNMLKVEEKLRQELEAKYELLSAAITSTPGGPEQASAPGPQPGVAAADPSAVAAGNSAE